MKEEEIIKDLEKYNQTRLINILNKVDKNTKKEIINEVSEINLKELERLYENIKNTVEVDVGELKPVKSINPDKLTKEEYNEFENAGIDVLKNNKFAVVIMSGGEGTRLGYNGPKGTFKIDVEPRPKYLFEIMADSIQ